MAKGGQDGKCHALLFLGFAVAGLTLVLFLVLHLLGLLPALVAPAFFERYATALHHQGWLPAVELGGLALLLAHPLLALVHWGRQRAALGAGPRRLRSRRPAPERLAALAGRWMPWSGAVLLVFLPLHLAQLRWPRPADGQELAALQAVLAQPWAPPLYGTASLAVTFHLLHGVEAAHRRLGWLAPATAAAIRSAGRLLAWGLGLGLGVLGLALPLLQALQP